MFVMDVLPLNIRCHDYVMKYNEARFFYGVKFSILLSVDEK